MPWPFGPDEATETAQPKESKSKWWTVKTYHKKSCEQHEHFVQNNGNGRILVTDGFRWCEYSVETTDGEFPQFEFTTVPGGNTAKDSLNMNSLSGPNIGDSELIEMSDGGCWGDVEITGVSEEQEVELMEFIDENGAWSLEDDDEWYLDDTDVYVWGPLEITDEDGNSRIIIADEDGNVSDFKDE